MDNLLSEVTEYITNIKSKPAMWNDLTLSKIKTYYRQIKLIQSNDKITTSILKRQLEDIKIKIDNYINNQLLLTVLPTPQRLTLSSLSLLSFVREKMYSYLCSKNIHYFSTPDVDNEYNVFDSLNIDVNHAARSKIQTFYCKSFVLRPHTTSLRGFVDNIKHTFTMGTVYRRDNDARHLPAFTQVDVTKVCNDLDELFTFLQDCISNIFNEFSLLLSSLGIPFRATELNFRFRQHYFPYTCPSFEIDLRCICVDGCSVCSNGWVEIAGCGILISSLLPKYLQTDMVMAFGMGLERLTSMLFYILLKEKKNIQSFYI